MQTPAQAALKPHQPRSRSGVRLLLVDQDEAIRDILAQLLQRAGYTVETAASADEVLQSGRQDWDCLVLELELPGLGGLELYARLLLLLGQVKLPAVFLSGRPPDTLELGLREAHWVRLLRKPCGFNDLLAALEQCLGAPRTL